MRGERPFVFTNLKSGEGLEPVVEFILHHGMIGPQAAPSGKPAGAARA